MCKVVLEQSHAEAKRGALLVVLSFFPNEHTDHGSAGFEISVGWIRFFDAAVAAGGAGSFETSAGSPPLLRGVFRCASDAMACAAAGAGEADAPSFCWVTDPLAADVSAGVA